tara:strand:- start:3615 stop:4514 length:900 start_codon:yes stop_codon:yes gene_type:complete
MSDNTQLVIAEDGSTITVGVRKPTNKELKEADIYRAKAWNKAFKEGVMTKAEVDQVMRDRGLWDDSKATQETKLTNEILDLEKELYIGNGKSKPKLSDGRRLALEMKQKRFELRDLISERLSMDENTAESLADNARFDYLVYVCSFNTETNERLFDSYEDYNNRGSTSVAIAAAQLLAHMVYNLDSDFEENLPENKFLKKFELVDENNQLIDPNTGDLIDFEGNRINELGQFINEDGERVDNEGNSITDEGLYEMVEYENDLLVKEKPKPKPRKRRTTKKTTTKNTAKEEIEATTETTD